MQVDLPTLFEAPKVLAIRPKWEAPDSTWFCLAGSLEIDGETIPGLELRGGACQTLPDRSVRFQLQYFPANGPCTHLARLEWRPNAPHTNPNIGPLELRMQRITGTHIHSFGLNWMPELGRMLTGNLPIAEPLADPASFEALLEIVGKEFRISGLDKVERPSWRISDLFGV